MPSLPLRAGRKRRRAPPQLHRQVRRGYGKSWPPRS